MSASIRGHQTALKLFRNGQQVELLTITSFDANMESSFNRAYYVGNPVGEGDQSVEGWSGTIEVEVKDATVDDMIDALITQNLNGVEVDEATIVDTEFYADGTSATYVYSDVQFKMSKRQSGLQEKVSKRLDWQASARARVS